MSFQLSDVSVLYAARMATIGVAEAKRQFSELLDRVSAGERIVISRRGEPAAALVPPPRHEHEAGDRPAPLGLLSLVGAIPEWEEIEPYVMEAFNNRYKAKSRPLPPDFFE
jgi:prevent-host-death family protein